MTGITRREAVLAAGLLPARLLGAEPRFRFGHHFYNWDRAWNSDLDLRLRLTKETGWEGFEAKPAEFGVPPEVLEERAGRLGLSCAAVGGALKEAIDYGAAAGAEIARALAPRRECARWVEYAAERGMIIVIHNHIGRKGRPGAVETREDLLRYLDERPGVYACPDTGHLLLCGSDPVRTIRDLGERCRYIHLKDIDPARVGTRIRGGDAFWELGTGALDLSGVMGALEQIGYRGWVMVERDRRVPDYAASARRMREALRRLGY